jgi:hypothetical protein
VLEHSSGHVIASTPPIREQVARFLTKMHDNRYHETGVTNSYDPQAPTGSGF